VAEISLAPPTVQVDPELMRQYQQEMEEAAQTALPDEDDADL
jgi:GTP-binding nuclear protein Ran